MSWSMKRQSHAEFIEPSKEFKDHRRKKAEEAAARKRDRNSVVHESDRYDLKKGPRIVEVLASSACPKCGGPVQLYGKGKVGGTARIEGTCPKKHLVYVNQRVPNDL
jgi:hypothetical protein